MNKPPFTIRHRSILGFFQRFILYILMWGGIAGIPFLCGAPLAFFITALSVIAFFCAWAAGGFYGIVLSQLDLKKCKYQFLKEGKWWYILATQWPFVWNRKIGYMSQSGQRGDDTWWFNAYQNTDLETLKSIVTSKIDIVKKEQEENSQLEVLPFDINTPEAHIKHLMKLLEDHIAKNPKNTGNYQAQLNVAKIRAGMSTQTEPETKPRKKRSNIN